MASLEKGVIVSIVDEKARVKYLSRPQHVSTLIVIPWWLRGTKGELDVGTEIIFSIFEDNTGIIISRADGNIYGLNE